MTLAEQRVVLVAAIAKGERRVRFQDREKEYQSIEQMISAVAFLDGEIAREAGQSSFSLASVRKSQ